MGGGRWPQLEELTQRYPQVRFLGAKGQDELPAYYNCADVFVFPSKTDTFGLVLLEAMACGIPVAAYPVEGPIDVVDNGVSGVLRQTSAGLPASPRSWTRKRYAPTPQPLLGGGHPAVPAAPAPGAPGGARQGRLPSSRHPNRAPSDAIPPIRATNRSGDAQRHRRFCRWSFFALAHRSRRGKISSPRTCRAGGTC
jgi:hypothetical protein